MRETHIAIRWRAMCCIDRLHDCYYYHHYYYYYEYVYNICVYVYTYVTSRFHFLSKSLEEVFSVPSSVFAGPMISGMRRRLQMQSGIREFQKSTPQRDGYRAIAQIYTVNHNNTN